MTGSIGDAGFHAVIDLGASRVCCIVFAASEDQIFIMGVGFSASAGIGAEGLLDAPRAEVAVRRAVAEAERMAGVRVSQLTIGVSSRRMKSLSFADGARPASSAGSCGNGVLRAAGLDGGATAEFGVVHAFQASQATPRSASDIANISTLIMIDRTVQRQYLQMFQRLEFQVEAVKSSTYAAALGCATPTARTGPVCVVDMGAETTGLTVLRDAAAPWVIEIPIGGRHVTGDLARGLSIEFDLAERLKVLFGCASITAEDDHDLIDLGSTHLGSASSGRIPRSMLVGIIRPRLEETFEMLRKALDLHVGVTYVEHTFVLTGGASQLPGLAELAQRLLGSSVASGQVLALPGLPEVAQGPAFAGAVGLARIVAAEARMRRSVRAEVAGDSSSGGFMRRLTRRVVGLA